MVISFMVKEAREHLEKYGLVYTLRPKLRKREGIDWYNHFRGDIKKGNVFIRYIGNYETRENKLVVKCDYSGFRTVKEWLERAGNSRYLYRVTMIYGNPSFYSISE